MEEEKDVGKLEGLVRRQSARRYMGRRGGWWMRKIWTGEFGKALRGVGLTGRGRMEAGKWVDVGGE